MSDSTNLSLDFRSDNVGAAAPAIAEALVEANVGSATPYGADPWNEQLSIEMSRVFGRPATVMVTSTATAANALGIAWLAGTGAPIYCHSQAHIAVSESGAVEFFARGSRLVPIDGADGKIKATDLARQQDRAGVLSLTQSTKSGTVYTLDELRELAAVAKARGLRVHVDGARLANGLAALGCSPAAFAEAAAMNALTFGSSKNGTIGADAVVFFDSCDQARLRDQWRRAGQLAAKARYPAAQLIAYLGDDRWLAWARRANGLAARLATGLAELPDVKIIWPVEANEVFAELTPPMLRALDAAGVLYKPWPVANATRFVCGFDTSAEAVDQLVTVVRNGVGGAD